jgi:glyoxylase-like metal-dependent hydrolase (beta-lactamase superfamily II)
LKKLGFDPAQIKYVVVSHAHRDHAGGAWYLQERFGARVLLTAPDWDELERNKQNWPKPKRDMVVADRQQLTLGDTTLTFVHTFGHTPGTMSTLVPVKDNGKPHVAALWGGTGFNFTITPQQPASHWFDAYITSAQRFREAAAKAGQTCFSRIIRAGTAQTRRWRAGQARRRRAESLRDWREKRAELFHDRRTLRAGGKASRGAGEVRGQTLFFRFA